MDQTERNRMIAQIREMTAEIEYLKGRNLSLSIAVQDLGDQLAVAQAEPNVEDAEVIDAPAATLN